MSEAAMWRAVESRDRAADGLFFLGVVTTGIFCRPSCPARRPRRENALFFASAEAARNGGLRPCLRCRPEDPPEPGLAFCQTVLTAVLAEPARRWSDLELSRRGFDPVQVRRAFLARFGHTFHGHLRALRVVRARRQLDAGRTLSEAGARSGFDSESGLRAAFRAVLDATPAQARVRSAIEFTHLSSPLGSLLAAANSEGVCLVEFDASADGVDAKARLLSIAARSNAAVVVGTNPHLERLAAELAQWFRGSRRTFDVPCSMIGTDFELEVWRRLRDVPYGSTATYGEIARDLGRPNGTRPVGRANGRNPIAILVPCHRVIGASGDLTGYAGGLDRKRWLLAHERRVIGA